MSTIRRSIRAAGMVPVEKREAPLHQFILIFATSGHVAGRVEAATPEAACTAFEGLAGAPDQRFIAGPPTGIAGYHVYDATDADLDRFEWADHDDRDYLAAIKTLPNCGHFRPD